MASPVEGVGGGNCLLCVHCQAEGDRVWCGLYGVWIVSPALDGAECPSFEEAA